MQADKPASGCGKCVEVVCADSDVREAAVQHPFAMQNVTPYRMTSAVSRPLCLWLHVSDMCVSSGRGYTQSTRAPISLQPNCPADAQPVTVQVVDSCPKCTAAQINLSYLTFSRKYVTARTNLRKWTDSCTAVIGQCISMSLHICDVCLHVNLQHCEWHPW
jgi:hypothetical protein